MNAQDDCYKPDTAARSLPVDSVCILPQHNPYKTRISTPRFVFNNPDTIYLHRCGDALVAYAVLRVKQWRVDRELSRNGARTNREFGLLRKKKKLISLTLKQLDSNSGEDGLKSLLRSYQKREKGIDKAILRERTRSNEFELRGNARQREQKFSPAANPGETNGVNVLNGRPPCGVAVNEPFMCSNSHRQL
jgi:hypothetical protein